jgi:hypothetical protein
MQKSDLRRQPPGIGLSHGDATAETVSQVGACPSRNTGEKGERVMRKLLASLAVLVLVGGMVMAQEATDVKTVTGVVAVTKSEAGEVTAVKVGDTQVVLDDNGKKLVDMAGKTVAVTGKMKEGKLAVETSKVVEKPAAAQ